MLQFLFGGSEEPAAQEPLMAGMHAWLERIKPGYGHRFAAAFDAIGVEDTEDFVNFDEELYALLEVELRRCGAKSMQLRYIQRAMHDDLAADGWMPGAVVTADEDSAMAAAEQQAPSPARQEEPGKVGTCRASAGFSAGS